MGVIRPRFSRLYLFPRRLPTTLGTWLSFGLSPQPDRLCQFATLFNTGWRYDPVITQPL